MHQLAPKSEEGRYEWVRHARIIRAEVPVVINGDKSLVWLECTQVVPQDVMREVVLQAVSRELAAKGINSR